jgi:hypothetical protein
MTVCVRGLLSVKHATRVASLLCSTNEDDEK